VNLGVAVGVVAEAVAEGALGLVVAFFELFGSAGGVSVGGGGGEGGHGEEVERGIGEFHFGLVLVR
jgi:hypothetical protein